MGYFFCAILSGLSALFAFSGGALLIQPADGTGRRHLDKSVKVLWLFAALATITCVLCLGLTLVHIVPGGGAPD